MSSSFDEVMAEISRLKSHLEDLPESRGVMNYQNGYIAGASYILWRIESLVSES